MQIVIEVLFEACEQTTVEAHDAYGGWSYPKFLLEYSEPKRRKNKLLPGGLRDGKLWSSDQTVCKQKNVDKVIHGEYHLDFQESYH